jgi:hypothetical protein
MVRMTPTATTATTQQTRFNEYHFTALPTMNDDFFKPSLAKLQPFMTP